jgi:hypothetical protein
MLNTASELKPYRAQGLESPAHPPRRVFSSELLTCTTRADTTTFALAGQPVLFRYQHDGYLVRTVMSLCLWNPVAQHLFCAILQTKLHQLPMEIGRR